MSAAQTLHDALKTFTLYSDDKLYVFVQLPPAALTAAAGVIAEYGAPFCALIADKDEVSLMLPQEAWEDFSERLPGHKLEAQGFRLITFDVVLQSSLVGFMAHISTALAAANIPIFPYAAYARDHLFVASSHFDTAINVLKSLKITD